MAMERVVIAVLLACSLIAMASAVPGTAKYYPAPHVPSSCFGFQHQGTMIAAVNSRLFANKANCGRRLKVRCTGGTNTVPYPCRNGEITVRIVDLCPSCGSNQIDLSREAFSVIADPNAGRINIDFTF